MTDPATTAGHAGGADAQGLAEAITPELFAMLEQLGFGVAAIDEANRFVFASDRWCEMVGRSRSDLLGVAHFVDLVVAEDRDRVLATLAGRLDGSVPPGRSDVGIVRGDGTEAIVHGGTRVAETPAGRVLVVTVRDVTEERAHERRIARYEEACRRMPTGFVVWQRDGEDSFSLQLANPAALRHLGPAAVDDEQPVVLPPDIDLDALIALDQDESVDLGEWSPGATPGRRPVHIRGFSLDGDACGLLFEDLSGVHAAGDERRNLLERLISVGDDERRVIADGLHDDTIQRLAACALLVESVRRHPEADDGRRRLLEVERELRDTVHSLRNLIFELTPPELDEGGLASAVERVASHLFSDVDVAVEIEIDVPPDLDHHVAAVTYRIATEALTNARRHAAASRVEIRLRITGDQLDGRVLDDGIGPDDVSEEPGHLGVRSMRERSEALGGELQVVRAPDGGTEVRWSVPARRSATPSREPRREYREWRPPDRRRPVPQRRPEDFDQLVESTTDIISCFDRSLRHVYVNAAVEAVAGLDRSEFLGRSNRDMGMPDDLADQWDDVILDTFRTGEVHRDTFVYPTPMGDRTFDARLIPERSRPDGPVLRVWGVVRDVSDYADDPRE